MYTLIVGLILFLATHLSPTIPGFRDRLVAKLGLNRYKLVFSVPALVGLVLIVHGVAEFRGAAADAQFWSPPLWTRHIAFALMLPAFVLLAAAYIPSKIRDRVGHPMLAAIMLWAIAHLAANGNLLAFLLFGSFLAFALYDRLSMRWRPAATRTPARGWLGDAASVAVGAGFWAATLFWLHAHYGVPLLPA